jgi:excisionase family DNA binding protein
MCVSGQIQNKEKQFMHPHSNPKRYLRITEASDEYNLSMPLLRKLIGKGRIRTVRPGGARVVLIERKDLDDMMQAGR